MISERAERREGTYEANDKPIISGFLVYNPIDLARTREPLRSKLVESCPQSLFFFATHFSYADSIWREENFGTPAFVLLIEGSREEAIESPQFTKFQLFESISRELGIKPYQFYDSKYGVIKTVPSDRALTFKQWSVFEGDFFSLEHHRDTQEAVFPDEFLAYAEEISKIPEVDGIRIQRAGNLHIDILLKHDPKRNPKMFLEKLEEFKISTNFKLETDAEFVAIGQSGNSLVYIPNIRQL